LTKKALVVGIASGYPDPYKLQGCVNDAADYKAVMIGKGFTVTTLLNTAATRNTILSKLNSLVTGLKSGDNIAFAYSGHGSQVPDTSGDEGDALDECLVSANMQAITDDELRTIFGKVPAGVTVDIFLDCCYSGTGTRDPKCVKTIGCRCVPGKAVKVVKHKELVIVPDMKHSLMAASRENQTSYEILVGSTPRGAFSYYVLLAVKTNGTRSMVVEYAAQRIAALGISQAPQLEATQAKADLPTFT
jgi:metacaspase-1